ncbi:MAG: hypothetical protein M1839_009334 [Geoglossum umbratile]|nr:MAG: hypothetical protein M1839_009334 [Geoglossum umbratile]
MAVTKGKMVTFGSNPESGAKTKSTERPPQHLGGGQGNNSSAGKQKPSRLRDIFRRKKKSESADLQDRSMNPPKPPTHAPGTPASGYDDDSYQATQNLLKSAVLSAKDEDIEGLKAQSDKILGLPDKYNTRPDTLRNKPGPRGICLQGHGIPGRMFLTDNSGRTQLVTGGIVGEICMSIRDTPRIGNARPKLSTLLFRADLSKKKGDLADAAWCYRQALPILC